ncbi:MAG: flavodoxin [Lachnospiraceae bacterium]
MKKVIAMLLAGVLLFGLTACSGAGNANTKPDNGSSAGQTAVPSETESGEAATSSQPEAEPATEGSRALVVYFSATGNTRAVAETIAEMQSADLYEIVPEQSYTDEDLNYNDSSSRATVEQRDENARPAILGGVENIEDYDVIYVGFPIWWGDMPRILCTFFDSYDLSEKTIAPFATSGGSGISRAVQSIEALEPQAAVTEGLLTSAANAESDVAEWLSGIGLANE